MRRADLTALIARVEAATEPEHDLDVDIAALFGTIKRGMTRYTMEPTAAVTYVAPHPYAGMTEPVLRYTSSVDAAASLVPKGFGYLVGVDDDTPVASVFPPHADRHWVAASNPVLALTAAALRAMLASMGDDA